MKMKMWVATCCILHWLTASGGAQSLDLPGQLGQSEDAFLAAMPAYSGPPYRMPGPQVPWSPVGDVIPPEAGYPGPWQWQAFPDRHLYRSYLAGLQESRLGTQFFYDSDEGGLWDTALGGRVGIWRFGSVDEMDPRGWQLDLEGAAFPRLDLEENMDMVSADFRAGGYLAWSGGPIQMKFGYYHISSHLGDELLLREPQTRRLNYARDALLLGVSMDVTYQWRVYAEAAWAFYTAGPAQPWEFLFGTEYLPRWNAWLHQGPFLAVHGHLREEVDFSGNLVVQLGWRWEKEGGRPVLRLGLHYLNGMSNQLQFFDQFEQQLGAGIWYDY